MCWDHGLHVSSFQISGCSQPVVPVDPMAPHRASAMMPTGTPSSEWWWEQKGSSKASRSGEYQQPTPTGKGSVSDCHDVSVFQTVQAADTS